LRRRVAVFGFLFAVVSSLLTGCAASERAQPSSPLPEAPKATGDGCEPASTGQELPRPITQVSPVYPQFAKDAQIQGTVILHVLVGADGRVERALVAKGVTGLNDAAVDAIKQWEFEPAIRDGSPICAWVVVPMTFHF